MSIASLFDGLRSSCTDCTDPVGTESGHQKPKENNLVPTVPTVPTRIGGNTPQNGDVPTRKRDSGIRAKIPEDRGLERPRAVAATAQQSQSVGTVGTVGTVKESAAFSVPTPVGTWSGQSGQVVDIATASRGLCTHCGTPVIWSNGLRNWFGQLVHHVCAGKLRADDATSAHDGVIHHRCMGLAEYTLPGTQSREPNP
jgi:hypothetical protein